MRAIHKVRLDKIRPAVILTRESAVLSRRNVTVAPITSTSRGLLSEVAVGPENGLDHDSVVNLDDISTVESDDVLEPIGFLTDADALRLLRALLKTFDLRLPPRVSGPPVSRGQI